MIVLGIDPSLTSTGFCVLEQGRLDKKVLYSGIITTKASEPLNQRIRDIYAGIAHIAKLFKLELMVIEKPYINSNAQTSIKLANLYGALLLLSAQQNIELLELAPSTIKKLISWNGRADKDLVAESIKHFVEFEPSTESFDETDAVAVALAGIHEIKKIKILSIT